MTHAIVPATTPALVAAARGLVPRLCRLARRLPRRQPRLPGHRRRARRLARPLRSAGRRAPLALGPGDTPAGTVALRRLDPATCEIKRLYVAPAARGAGLGARLATAIVAEARRLGYRRAVLDTLPFMAGAQRLYAGLGFRDIAPYQPDPHHGLRFMGRDL